MKLFISILFCAMLISGLAYAEPVRAIIDNFDDADPGKNFLNLDTNAGRLPTDVYPADLLASFDVFGANPANPLNTAHQLSWDAAQGATPGPDDAYWYSFVSDGSGLKLPVGSMQWLRMKIQLGEVSIIETGKRDIIGIDLQVNYPEGVTDSEGKPFRVYRAYQPLANETQLDIVAIPLYDFHDEFTGARFTDSTLPYDFSYNCANLRAVAIAMTDPTDTYMSNPALGLDNEGTIFIEDVELWAKGVAITNGLLVDNFEDPETDPPTNCLGNPTGGITNATGFSIVSEQTIDLADSKRHEIVWDTAQSPTPGITQVWRSDVSNGGTALLDVSSFTHLAYDALSSEADMADLYEVEIVVEEIPGFERECFYEKVCNSKRIQEEYIPLNKFHFYESGGAHPINPEWLTKVKEIRFRFGQNSSYGNQPLGDNTKGMIWIDNLKFVTLSETPLYNNTPIVRSIDGQYTADDFIPGNVNDRRTYSKVVVVGVPMTLDVIADDPDADITSLELFGIDYPDNGGYPPTVSFIVTNNGAQAVGTMSWTPTAAWIGINAVSFIVTDSKGARDIQQFNIVVNGPPPPDNNPPVFMPWEGWIINEMEPYSWAVVVTDPDEDNVTLTASNMPEGMLFDGYRMFDWQPRDDQAGDYTVLLTATDEHGATASMDMTITVRDVVTSYYIKGKVCNALTSAPLSGVTVTLKPHAYGYGTHDYTTTTDENGDYRVDSMIGHVQSSGGTVTWIKYRAYVSAGGYQDYVSDEMAFSETVSNFTCDAPLIPLDQDPPELTVTTPAKYTSAAEGSIIPVEGTVTDASAVQVFVRAGDDPFIEVAVVDGVFSTTMELTGLPTNGELLTIEVKAEDAAQNTTIVPRYIVNGYLHLIELPRYYSKGESPLGLSSIATAQDIIDLMRPDADGMPLENDIYSYAHARNLPANQGIAELDPNGMDAALEHYDIYAQGYNYGIESFADMNNYLKEIVHWMSWPVSKQWWTNYAPEGADPLDPAYAEYFTAAPYVPVVAPLSADMEGYNKWAVINGYAADISPYEYETQPWKYAYHTNAITIYGMFMTNPSVAGEIGKDTYIAASQLTDCLKPLASADTYNGKYVMVAEPPDEELNFEVQPAPAVVNQSTEKLVEIAEYANSGEVGTLERHLIDSTLVVDLKKRNSATSFSTTADLSALFTGNVGNDASAISWDAIIPAPLLLNADFKEAVQGSVAREFLKVLRKDTGESYYIIPFDKLTGGQFASYAAIAVDAVDGHFLEGSCVKEATRYIQITKEEAIAKVIGLNPMLEGQEIDAQLVWERGGLTASLFYPYWEVTTCGEKYYVLEK